VEIEALFDAQALRSRLDHGGPFYDIAIVLLELV
jgi:hypothetical protein